MTIISNTQFSSDIIYIGGGFMTVFLIVSLIAALLLVDTKYQNKLISDTFNICSNPLLVIFVIIVMFRVMLII